MSNSDRAMSLVYKDGKILMVQLYCMEHLFWSLPGGGIEEGESPEEAAIRELKEEAGVDGEIIRPLTVLHTKEGRKEYTFLVRLKDENQKPSLGYDPEYGDKYDPNNPPMLRDLAWKNFDELSRVDQDYMMSYGFMQV